MALHHMLRAAVQQQAAGPSDPYFYDVSLLLTGDGTNGAQNNTFLDSSSNNFTITRNGNTTQGTFSPYGSLWSNYFNGSSYLTAASNAAFAFGTGDFTVEFWINTPSYSSYRSHISTRSVDTNNYFGIGSQADGTFYFYSGGFILTSSTQPTNTWLHVAVARQSGTAKMFINGALQATASMTNDFLAGVLAIGAAPTGGEPSTGYFSNVRIVKGTALYTSAFTPSTTPLTAVSGTSLLTCQSNRFIDNSSNNFTLTVNGSPSVQRFSPFNPTAAYSAATIGGSGYYNGTSPTSLSIPYSASYGTFTGDFTIECWAYEISHVNYTSLISTAASSGGGWFFGYSNSQNLCFYYGGSFYLETAWQKVNRWSHVAVTRSGSTLRLYIDGTQQATATLSGTISADSGHSAVTGHRWNDTNEYFWNGYITDIRILNGTALYTDSTYTVPTAPLTAISNTQLLLSSTNAGIPDAAMMNDLETIGTCQVSTSVKKYGTGSIYVNGSSNYLTCKAIQPYLFGTADFTVEGWFYLSSNGNTTFWSLRQSGNNNFECTYYPGDGSYLRMDYDGTTICSSGSGTQLSTNTWYHIACVRYSGTIKIYLNGTSVANTSTSYNANSIASPMNIGYGPTGAALVGYVDDFRVSSFARYTANFTPPTAALPVY